MIKREFIGKSEEELLSTIEETLKISRDKLDIKFETKNSFLGFGKKEVIAKVTYNEDDSFSNRALILIKNILERMDVNAKIYLIEEDDEKVVIEIESPDSAMIIGKKGQNLEAIQTLVNVIMNKNYQKWTKVIIDIGNYRLRREKVLRKLALDVARQVKAEKSSVLLEPMNPFERRIIHLTLKDFDNIETISEGEGTIKRIKVHYVENKVGVNEK